MEEPFPSPAGRVPIGVRRLLDAGLRFPSFFRSEDAGSNPRLTTLFSNHRNPPNTPPFGFFLFFVQIPSFHDFCFVQR